MAKIVITVPESSYKTEIDTETMDVEIKESFLGVTFTTLEGKKLFVSQRDGGFELSFIADPSKDVPIVDVWSVS